MSGPALYQVCPHRAVRHRTHTRHGDRPHALWVSHAESGPLGHAGVMRPLDRGLVHGDRSGGHVDALGMRGGHVWGREMLGGHDGGHDSDLGGGGSLGRLLLLLLRLLLLLLLLGGRGWRGLGLSLLHRWWLETEIEVVEDLPDAGVDGALHGVDGDPGHEFVQGVNDAVPGVVQIHLSFLHHHGLVGVDIVKDREDQNRGLRLRLECDVDDAGQLDLE